MPRPRLTGSSFVLALFALFAPALAGDARLVVEPAKVTLADAYARRQLLVSIDGKDVTAECQFESSAPAIIDLQSPGYVVPKSTGAATVTVRHAGQTQSVPVTIEKFDAARPVDFAADVVPLLSRYGCNAGSCHGKASGQNGFKLSLLGFDSRYDYEQIVEQARGRRIFPAAPDESLLLAKAAGAVPHGGGRRLEPGSEPYEIVRRWIAQGAPASSPDAARVTRLVIAPASRVMSADERQQLSVEAEYSDGTRRDVTRQAEYSSNLEIVAAVSSTGEVRTVGRSGEAAIMVRYLGKVSVFHAIVPHGTPLKETPGFVERNYVDHLVATKWRQLGLKPSPPASDAAFLRRVTIDLCGRLPTIDEARTYLAGKSANKRDALVDRLLASADYPAYFALKWSSILRNSRLAGADEAAYAFHHWIKDMIAQNRPYDEFVRGVVAAAGEWQEAPAINWFWQMRDDQLHQPTADTAQVFLGIRLQCARCHHHPYERWGQDDYYGLAGFFTRLGRKSFGQPPPYYAASRITLGEKNPLTGQSPEPKYLDGPVAELSPDQDPRHALVDWMSRDENPFFARTLVNRMWGHFFGRGIVEPVDDMRETNPPSNPELLEALAKDFRAHHFDVRHIIRTLVTSNAYALDSVPMSENENDSQNFARFYGRRLIAEVLLDAVDQACGTRSRFERSSSEARAVDLPHEGFGSYFLDTFDRPKRVSGCECERSSGATLGQVLLLSNSNEIENKLSAGEGLVDRSVKGNRPAADVIEDMYLGALGRLPISSEKDRMVAFVEQSKDAQERRAAFEDVLWTLLNSKEFLYNH
jgi:hypothetical protein